MKWLILLAMLGGVLRLLAGAPKLYTAQPTKARRVLVASFAAMLIGLQIAISLELIYFRPKREREQLQTVGNAWVDVQNDNSRFAMVDDLHQTALNLTILCAVGRLAGLPPNENPTRESIEVAANDLREHEEALAVVYRSLVLPPELGSSRSTETSMCEFAKRLQGLSALKGAEVGTLTWHYPLANGEALELAVGAAQRLHFTRIVSASERSRATVNDGVSIAP